jgi:hypothetical protein
MSWPAVGTKFREHRYVAIDYVRPKVFVNLQVQHWFSPMLKRLLVDVVFAALAGHCGREHNKRAMRR